MPHLNKGKFVLNYKAIARLPDRILIFRNGWEAQANRVQRGEIDVVGHSIKIADAAYGEAVSPLPVRVPNGRHMVYSYEWNHPWGPISTCAVVQFGQPRLSVVRSLVIQNDMRPDLTEGIIVDSAEARVAGASCVTLTSGLGDGYYPVFGIFNFGFFVQAIVLDFKIWQVREVVRMPGVEIDKYGISRSVH